MKKLQRIIAMLLCAVMLISVMPMQTLAAELAKPAENSDTVEPDAEDMRLAEESVKTDTDADAPLQETQAEANQTDLTSGAEDSTQADAAQPVDPPDDPWIYTVDQAGYAEVLGYRDLSVTELSVPDAIDGHYVTSIGKNAFVENTALKKIYVHGNVTQIAGSAFRGLDVKLLGYNGTRVLSFAQEHGFDSKNLSSNRYYTLLETVVDYSYAASGRWTLLNDTTIRFAKQEAALLKKGSVFYVPDKTQGERFGLAYQVLSLKADGDDVIASIEIADLKNVVTRYQVNEELLPDWSTAEWADGVEVTQEKGLAHELGGSVNIEYEKEIFDHIKLTATGAFSLTGKFEFDYSGDGLKKCDLSLEPTLNAKITLSGAGNNDEGHKKLRKNKQPASVYLGKVTLCSVFVVNVDCAVYLRINAEGSATINMQILGGKYGFHYSPATSSMEKFKTRSAPKVSFDGKIEITCGLVPAVELHLSLLGKFMSMELFLGVKTAVTWSTQHVECVNIDIDFEISIELKFELDLEKKFGKKLKGFSFGKTFTIADFTIDIVDFHFENWKKVDSCSYGSNTVDFCTFTNTKLNKITVDSDTYIDEPKISLKNNKLLGWYTDKNFVNKWNFKRDAVTSDMTLYAKWENTAQTVLFKSEQLDENNKEIMADWTAEYVPGSQLVQPDIKVKHYRLLGWYTDPKLKAKDKWDFENDIMPNNSLTLYAKWEYDESYDPYANEGQNYTIQNGMLYFNGHVYKHIPQDTLFSAAKADCESQGGYLLTVTSKEEMDAVLAYVRNDCAQEALWLGINSSTLWEHWLTGEKVTYWNGDKPSSSSGQYNGIFFNNSTGTWSSIDNSQLRHYVIEWGDDYQVDPDFHSNQDENAVTYFDDSTGVSVVGFNGRVKRALFRAFTTASW